MRIRERIILAAAALMMVSCAKPEKIKFVSLDSYAVTGVTLTGASAEAIVTVNNESGAKAKLKEASLVLYDASGREMIYASIEPLDVPKGLSRIPVYVAAEFPAGVLVGGIFLKKINDSPEYLDNIYVSGRLKARNGAMNGRYIIKKQKISDLVK